MVQTKKTQGWFRRHRHKIGLIAIGHTAKKIEEHVVDWLIYGVVITYFSLKFGPLYGSILTFGVMTPLTAVLCLAYIRLYDWAGKDWLGFEALKELREEQSGGGFFAKLTYRLARHGGIVAFFALSIYGDAFMTTVYLRKGSHAYNGLSLRDHGIFWSSLIVSNAYWTLRWVVIIELLKMVIQYVF